MKILVTNDDGIEAEGLKRLVKMATQLGEVVVVAPASQCSAMSSRISLRKPMVLKEYDYPVEGVKAYSLEGTPADCVKVALSYIIEEIPDYVFSGMNFGFNTGYDIIYSGTIGAAMEGLLHGIPSIAFSNDANDCYDIAEEYMLAITKKLIENPPAENQIYNVNFPGCKKEELAGIRENVKISHEQIYKDHYYKEENDGVITVEERGDLSDKSIMKDGTDVYAVLHNYISIGTVTCNVI